MINNMYRWVDPRVKDVSVAAMRAYLARQGWKEQPAPQPTLLVFEAPFVDDDGRPIIQVLPNLERFADYQQRLIELITSLAVIEDRLAVEVLNDILQANTAPPRNAAPRRPARKPKTTKL